MHQTADKKLFMLACAILAMSAHLHAEQTAEQPDDSWLKLAKKPVSISFESSTIYDRVNKKLVVFAGHGAWTWTGNFSGGQSNDQWVGDPATGKWDRVRPPEMPPEECCVSGGMVYDLANQITVYPASGHNDNVYSSRQTFGRRWSMWVYDTKENRWYWRHRYSNPICPTQIGSYDEESQVVVYVGGEGNEATMIPSVYDAYTNTWSTMKPPEVPKPQNLHYCVFVYDPVRKVHYFCTSKGQAKETGTWEYSLSDDRWTRIADGPEAVGEGTCAVFDTVNRKVLAFYDSREGDAPVMDLRIFDPESKTWSKSDSTTAAPARATAQVAYEPESARVFFMGGCFQGNQKPWYDKDETESDLWTYRYKAPRPEAAKSLARPTGLKAVTAEGGKAKLSWNAVEGAAGYIVFRGRGDAPWKIAWTKISKDPVTQPNFEDSGLEAGIVAYYRVSAINAQQDSRPSYFVRTQQPIVDGIVVSVLGEHDVEIQWRKSAAADVVGYKIYRDDGAGFQRLTDKALTELVYVDKSANLAGMPRPIKTISREEWDRGNRNSNETKSRGGNSFEMEEIEAVKRMPKHHYRVVAVNALGVESGPSLETWTLPSPPRDLRIQKSGSAAKLTWQANPERKIAGYLVYRMDGIGGSWDFLSHGLTPAPIKDTSFTDETVQKKCQYAVAAVDEFGQESIASSGIYWLDDAPEQMDEFKRDGF